MAAESDLHDPSLAALMREHSTEVPSPDVDSAILASAHDAIRLEVHRTRVGRFFRVALPIAAAASIAVVIVHLQPVVPTPPPSAKPSMAEKPRFDSARLEDTRKEDAEKRTADAQKTPAQAAAPQPQSPRIANSFSAPPGNVPVQPSQSGANEGSDIRQAGAAARGGGEHLSIRGRADAPTPDQWIARIRALRDAGKQQEALDELARFRATFPDANARLPEDLRALR
jgi:hypothetical protein